MNTVIGVGSGVVTTNLFTPLLVKGLSKVWSGAANPQLSPVMKIVTGGVAGAIAGFLPVGSKSTRKKLSGYMVAGGGLAALLDVLNAYVVPQVKGMLGLSGYQGMGDYVQLPYSGQGMGDYVQLPYSGYGAPGMGTPAQVEAGSFGTPAQVEAGSFGALGMADTGGTFAPSFG